MSTVENRSFETQGGAPGDADAWSVAVTSGGFGIHGFAFRENDLGWSERFDKNTGAAGEWSAVQSSVTPDVRVTWDGENIADGIVDNVSFGLHGVLQGTTLPATPDVYLSVEAHAGTRSWLLVGSSNNAVHAYFDLENGVVGSVTSGGIATMTDLGSGWYRCQVHDAAAAPQVFGFYAADSDGGVSYTGDATTAVYLARALLQRASASATPYVATGQGGLIQARPCEGFEDLWGADGYITILEDSPPFPAPAVFGATYTPPDAAEGFERGWGADPGNFNERYLQALDGLTANLGLTGGGHVEDFESWVSGVYIVTDPEPLPSTPVVDVFDDWWPTYGDAPSTGAYGPETFEDVFTSLSNATGGASTDLITRSSHGLIANQRVQFVPAPGAELPSPLSEGVTYKVTSPSTSTFKVALASGGGDLDLTTDGSGTFTIMGAPDTYWNDPITSW